MQLLYLTLSIFFSSGFYYLGEKICKVFDLDKIIEKISNPKYQYFPLGVSFFLFVTYPFFFIGIYDKSLFKIISYLFIIFGIINIKNNFNNFYNFLKICFNNNLKFEFFNSSVILLIIFYFFLSISPITSGDSLSYHLGAAKYILEFGHFPKDLLSTEIALIGSGEFFNTFAISINAYQLTSLINFFGLISILAIIQRFCDTNKLSKENQKFVSLLILSCPVLVFLISSSKSQLFATSLIFICYGLLVYYLNNSDKKKIIIKSSIILIILPIVAVQTKLSFSISFFIIISTFFLYFCKKLNLKKFIFIFIIFFLIGLIPHTLWKQSAFDYPFYNFLINPFPLNSPGYDEAYFDVKNYFSEKFPFILFMPLELSDLTQFIGIGIISIYFLFLSDFKNKKIILAIIMFFLIIYSIFGQRAARFYIEIYFLTILAFTFVISKIKTDKLFKLFKTGIVLQSIFVLCITSYGVFTLFPGSLSEKLNKKILSKYASGYNLYNWANKTLPSESVALIKHRSYFFAEKNIIYVGMTGFFKNANQNEKKLFVNKLKQKNPNYIIFYGNEDILRFDNFNFADCITKLYSKKKDVGFYETRNPFSSDKNYYNGYIYQLDTSKMPDCVSF